MYKALACSILAAASAMSAPASAAPKQPNTGLARIVDAMAAQGQLSQHDAQRLRRAALEDGAGPFVPLSRGPEGTVDCLTEAMRLAKEWARGQGAHLSSVPPPSVGFLDSQTLPLRVYYQEESDQPTATLALVAAEEAWKNQVETAGYPRPFTGDGESPDVVDGLWIYVTDSVMGTGGYAEFLTGVPSTPNSDCAVRVVIDRGNPENYLNFVVTHEFNHSTQAATDCIEARSAWENFATAVAAHYFPLMLQSQIGAFQNHPEYPIDYFVTVYDELGNYPYAAGLFPAFLQQRYGGGDIALLRDIWNSFAQEGTVDCSYGCTSETPNAPDWFEGTAKVLSAHGATFDQAFDEFTVWRAITGTRDDQQHFPNGSKFPSVVFVATHSLAELPVKSETIDVMEYGSRYIRLNPGSSKMGLHVTVAVDPEASWSSYVLLGRTGTPVEALPLTFCGRPIGCLRAHDGGGDLGDVGGLAAVRGLSRS